MGMQEGQEAWSRENETNIDTRNGRSSIWMEGPSDFHDAKMADRRPVSKSQ